MYFSRELVDCLSKGAQVLGGGGGGRESSVYRIFHCAVY